MGRIAIPITKAMELFPTFKPKWSIHHPQCDDPRSVAIGNPEFCTVRHMVIVETDSSDNPINPLYDKMQVEEGPVGQNFPGTIVIPWFADNRCIHIVLRKKQREIRNTFVLELPQGYAEKQEDAVKTGLRELKEEIPDIEVISTQVLPSACPEPDWFPRATAIVAAKIYTICPTDNIQIFRFDAISSWTTLIDSGTTLAALMRFYAWKTEPYN